VNQPGPTYCRATKTSYSRGPTVFSILTGPQPARRSPDRDDLLAHMQELPLGVDQDVDDLE